MASNDYKSMEGLWKKLSEEEKRKFVRENVDKSMISSGLVYLGVRKGNSKSVSDKSVELMRLEEHINKAIYFRERPAINFD